MFVRLVVMLDLLATPTPGGQTAASNGGLFDGIIKSPESTAIRGVLTLLVVVIALTGGRWLASVAGRVPVRVPVGVQSRLRHAGRRADDVSTVQTDFSSWVGRVTTVCIWLAVVIAIAFIWFFNAAIDSGTQKTIGNTLRALAWQVTASFVVLAAALGIGRALQRGVLKTMDRQRTNANLILLGGRFIYIATLVVGLIAILAIWGTGLVVPVALIGALTVALSLALQDVLKNLVAGVYLLLERPFVIGDHIALNSYSGEVEDIQIRYTALRTLDNQRVLIPNSLLFGSPVTNLTAFDRRRATLAISVPDSGPESVDQVEEQIRTALKKVPGVLESPPPLVTLNGAGEGKVDLHVVFWMPNKRPGDVAALYSDVIEQVRTQVRDAQVSQVDATSAAV
ncbi:MAG TPA: mechanosensitive ion channel family protein [Ktedonobacterales bacterium]|nr:mechanosensitive ion channel family protein [Ktedonobacterales bacterium]